MSPALLTINSKNYGAWSLRGWLLCRMAGLEFTENVLQPDDERSRAELLLLSPSFLVPRLEHGDITVWGTLAIAGYLIETFPGCGLLPDDPVDRGLCRSISDEMHSGFASMRSALPFNVRARYSGFKIWSGAQADIVRITEIWQMCLERSGGPYLFGRETLADAMYAPVCSRFLTYDVALDSPCAQYRDHVLSSPLMREWIEGAEAEEDHNLEELEAEF